MTKKGELMKKNLARDRRLFLKPVLPPWLLACNRTLQARRNKTAPIHLVKELFSELWGSMDVVPRLHKG